MGKKIFAEKNFNIDSKVIPFEEYKPFSFLKNGFKINEGHRSKLIEMGEKALEKEIPQLLASDFMLYYETGDRATFEGKYFARRTMMVQLALAEHLEGKSRFTKKLIDVIWVICDEVTWVVPAHNPGRPGKNRVLPFAYDTNVTFIDLFSAATAAAMAFTYYISREALDKVTDIITGRMLYEIDRNIVSPYLDNVRMYDNWWTNENGRVKINNWLPWIVSNVLSVCAFSVKEHTKRKVMISKSMDLLDKFTAIYPDDGACDEGPSYWGAAGGALFNACEAIYDLTGGYVNVFDAPLLKNIGEYAIKMLILPNRTLNFSDAPASAVPSPMLAYRFGKACGSGPLETYGKWKLNGKLPNTAVGDWHIYSSISYLCEDALPTSDFVAPERFFFESIQVAGARESSEIGKGLYVALKGGTNGENHNHCDLGNVVVFADDKPIFIDAGQGRYTARYLGKERYTVWSNTSLYHNCVTFNGTAQLPGADYRTSIDSYDKESGKLVLDLSRAYPTEASVERHKRSAMLENGVITIEDDIRFSGDGEIMFTYLTVCPPESVSENSFELYGRRVTFDDSLEYKCEAADHSLVETEGFPRSWGTDSLYRVTLTSRTPIKEKKYIMTIK